MTTVVWTGPLVASDSRAIADELILPGNMEKIILRNGKTYALAGDVAQCMAVVDWLEKGGKVEDAPDFIEPEFTVLQIVSRTKAWVFCNEMYPYEISPPTAIGTGRQVALGAMAAGASAQEAVTIACEFDPYSSAPVKVVKIPNVRS